MTPAQGLRQLNQRLAVKWSRLSLAFLPFADVASTELPLRRLLRLALFQVSVGMAYALLRLRVFGFGFAFGSFFGLRGDP